MAAVASLAIVALWVSHRRIRGGVCGHDGPPRNLSAAHRRCSRSKQAARAASGPEAFPRERGAIKAAARIALRAGVRAGAAGRRQVSADSDHSAQPSHAQAAPKTSHDRLAAVTRSGVLSVTGTSGPIDSGSVAIPVPTMMAA